MLSRAIPSLTRKIMSEVTDVLRVVMLPLDDLAGTSSFTY